MVAEKVTDRHELPPGPAGLPLVGNLPQFQRDPLAFVRGVQRSYGNLATVRLGRDVSIIMCFRPEHARLFLVDRARDFITGSGRIIMRHFLGDGLLTTDGDFHRQQRRLVQPAFHKKRVESYAGIMVDQTTEQLDRWRAGQELDVARELQELTLRIVVKALFDVDLATEGHALSQAFNDLIEGQNPFVTQLFPFDLPFTPYHRALVAADRLDDFVYRLIAQRRAEGRDTGDVLSMLLQTQDEEDGTGLTDKQVRDQTMTLIAAGHETTSNALAWTFHLLSQHPDKRDKLLGELRTVLAGRPIMVDDLSNLPYLDWVVTESMRIYPPAWTLGRTSTAPFELEGYRFPAGTRVMFPQWVIHYLPDVWGDPEEFRPERWDPEGGFKPPQGAYFPFGAGPRICIGMPFAQMEARLLLATILQRYVPEVVPGWRVEPLPRVTLRLKHGLRVRVKASAAA
jgi:cytochrome P450